MRSRMSVIAAGAKVASRNDGVTLTAAPRLLVFHSALHFPKESASEREGFVIQAPA
jgi:hypothetical protein